MARADSWVWPPQLPGPLLWVRVILSHRDSFSQCLKLFLPTLPHLASHTVPIASITPISAVWLRASTGSRIKDQRQAMQAMQAAWSYYAFP